ncbi:MAG: hypothetical protein ACYST0_08975, partial [Planctomycetota bacterium]
MSAAELLQQLAGMGQQLHLGAPGRRPLQDPPGLFVTTARKPDLARVHRPLQQLHQVPLVGFGQTGPGILHHLELAFGLLPLGVSPATLRTVGLAIAAAQATLGLASEAPDRQGLLFGTVLHEDLRRPPQQLDDVFVARCPLDDLAGLAIPAARKLHLNGVHRPLDHVQGVLLAGLGKRRLGIAQDLEVLLDLGTLAMLTLAMLMLAVLMLAVVTLTALQMLVQLLGEGSQLLGLLLAPKLVQCADRLLQMPEQSMVVVVAALAAVGGLAQFLLERAGFRHQLLGLVHATRLHQLLGFVDETVDAFLRRGDLALVLGHRRGGHQADQEDGGECLQDAGAKGSRGHGSSS